METNSTLQLSAIRTNWIVGVILGLFPLVGMGVDLIAPSLPAISKDLHVSNVLAKNLIAVYLFGYALGNFLNGFLSDTLGRRRLIAGSFLLFTLISLLPAFFANPLILLSVRMIQGFALGSFSVVSRAIFADILPVERLIHVSAWSATSWGIGPIIGPLIGGYLQYYFGWQACFYFFAAYGCVGVLLLVFIIPETHFHRQLFNVTHIKNNFVFIITHRMFIGLVTIMGLTYSLLIAFNTLGPFLIQTVLGYTSIYFGHVALILGITFLLGTIFCRRLLPRFTPEKILQFTIIFFLLVAMIGLIFSCVNSKSTYLIITLSAILFFAVGVMYPASLGKSVSLFRHLAGSASAVMNLINVLLTSLTAFLVSFIHITNIIPIASIYCILLVLCGLSYWQAQRAR